MSQFPIPYQHSSHETQLIEFFGRSGLRLDDAELPSGLRTYVICFTNRCGSNLLADLISTNRNFGKAGEYFNAPGVVKSSTRLNFHTLQQYVKWLAGRLASERRILGVKLAFHQLFFLTEMGLLPRAFGEVRFIHIERRDVAAQAVSHVIAAQTKAWTSEHERRLPDEKIVFSPERVVSMISRIHEANAKFRSFFDIYGISPVRATYEELVREPQLVGDRVLRELAFAGIEDCSVAPAALKLTRQSNELNKSFIARLRNQYQTFSSEKPGRPRVP